MASDIGITNLLLVGNKVSSDADLRFIENSLPNIPICGFLGNSDLAVQADRSGESLYGLDADLASSIAVIAAAAEETCRDHFPMEVESHPPSMIHR
ncbi:Cobyrinic acid ac-diamide synthase [mine drainage metagenome]|uniref:Cobyrinic acid ac-diamide synthase n=1 Tax=mine drainage metagenome TaxID=410659 RepID=T0YQ64_9ZZZZ